MLPGLWNWDALHDLKMEYSTMKLCSYPCIILWEISIVFKVDIKCCMHSDFVVGEMARYLSEAN